VAQVNTKLTMVERKYKLAATKTMPIIWLSIMSNGIRKKQCKFQMYIRKITTL